MNDLEWPLAGLRPVLGTLNRDRMLYEAGRASARGEARDRLLMAASALLLVASLGLGGLLVQERARRQALEVALAARDQEAIPPSEKLVLPKSSPVVEIAPTSYLALSRHIQPGGLDEVDPPIEDAGQGDSAEGSESKMPIRVRDARGILDF